MPLDKLILIIVAVIVAAGLTVWIGVAVAAATQFPLGFLILVPMLGVIYVLWRVISDRIANKEDDYYDRIDK